MICLLNESASSEATESIRGEKQGYEEKKKYYSIHLSEPRKRQNQLVGTLPGIKNAEEE